MITEIQSPWHAFNLRGMHSSSYLSVPNELGLALLTHPSSNMSFEQSIDEESIFNSAGWASESSAYDPLAHQMYQDAQNFLVNRRQEHTQYYTHGQPPPINTFAAGPQLSQYSNNNHQVRVSSTFITCVFLP